MILQPVHVAVRQVLSAIWFPSWLQAVKHAATDAEDKERNPDTHAYDLRRL